MLIIWLNVCGRVVAAGNFWQEADVNDLMKNISKLKRGMPDPTDLKNFNKFSSNWYPCPFHRCHRQRNRRCHCRGFIAASAAAAAAAAAKAKAQW